MWGGATHCLFNIPPPPPEINKNSLASHQFGDLVRHGNARLYVRGGSIGLGRSIWVDLRSEFPSLIWARVVIESSWDHMCAHTSIFNQSPHTIRVCPELQISGCAHLENPQECKLEQTNDNKGKPSPESLSAIQHPRVWIVTLTLK